MGTCGVRSPCVRSVGPSVWSTSTPPSGMGVCSVGPAFSSAWGTVWRGQPHPLSLDTSPGTASLLHRRRCTGRGFRCALSSPESYDVISLKEEFLHVYNARCSCLNCNTHRRYDNGDSLLYSWGVRVEWSVPKERHANWIGFSALGLSNVLGLFE